MRSPLCTKFRTLLNHNSRNFDGFNSSLLMVYALHSSHFVFFGGCESRNLVEKVKFLDDSLSNLYVFRNISNGWQLNFFEWPSQLGRGWEKILSPSFSIKAVTLRSFCVPAFISPVIEAGGQIQKRSRKASLCICVTAFREIDLLSFKVNNNQIEGGAGRNGEVK